MIVLGRHTGLGLQNNLIQDLILFYVSISTISKHIKLILRIRTYKIYLALGLADWSFPATSFSFTESDGALMALYDVDC